MDYLLTKHAREALEKRQISVAWLERTLDQPTWTEPDPLDSDLEHRLAAVPEFGDRVLRVIVNSKVAPLRVITAYFDRRKNRP